MFIKWSINIQEEVHKTPVKQTTNCITKCPKKFTTNI